MKVLNLFKEMGNLAAESRGVFESKMLSYQTQVGFYLVVLMLGFSISNAFLGHFQPMKQGIIGTACLTDAIVGPCNCLSPLYPKVYL